MGAGALISFIVYIFLLFIHAARKLEILLFSHRSFSQLSTMEMSSFINIHSNNISYVPTLIKFKHGCSLRTRLTSETHPTLSPGCLTNQQVLFFLLWLLCTMF